MEILVDCCRLRPDFSALSQQPASRADATMLKPPTHETWSLTLFNPSPTAVGTFAAACRVKPAQAEGDGVAPVPDAYPSTARAPSPSTPPLVAAVPPSFVAAPSPSAPPLIATVPSSVVAASSAGVPASSAAAAGEGRAKGSCQCCWCVHAAQPEFRLPTRCL